MEKRWQFVFFFLEGAHDGQLENDWAGDMNI